MRAFYPVERIKRVRLVRRADGYYCQFCIQVDVTVKTQPTKHNVGLDVGLKDFYTDSDGNTEPNPRFYRNSEKRMKFYQRRVSRKNQGSANRKKAINKLGRVHLVLKSLAGRKPTPPRQFLHLGKPQDRTGSTFRKISRQRQEHAKRLARCVILSNDMVAYEDLRIKNLVKNHCLAVLKSLAGRKPTPPRQFLHLGRPQDRTASTFRKSINDAGWYQFRKWLEYFGKKFGKVTVAVNPAYTTQNCSSCGTTVKKSLSTRTHVCRCGCILDRDPSGSQSLMGETPKTALSHHNAAINILNSALSTTGHVGTWINNPNALGDQGSTEIGECSAVLGSPQVEQLPNPKGENLSQQLGS